MLASAAIAVLHLAAPSPEPAHTPQLASAGGVVALAFGSGNGLYVAISSNEGQSFAKPVKVAEAHILPLTRHRGPRIAISKGVIVVSAVMGHQAAAGEHSHGLAADGDLIAVRSLDGGKTWSKAVRINDVPAAPREGLHTLAADASGRLFAAWLDLRRGRTALYGSVSSDGGATWASSFPIYESPAGTICNCCHPSAAFSADGSLDIMWRNVLDGARDFYLTRRTAGGKFGTPEKLGKGTWKIDACPMDGGGLVHVGARTVTAWRRENEVFLAEPGQAELRLGEGKDVALAESRGVVHAAWIKGTQLEAWSAGRKEVLAPKAAYPSLTGLPGGGALAAWEEGGRIALRRIP